MLDLHIHSSYSDGSETPETLVRLAKAAHVRAIALTDHDNADGVPEFLEACRQEGLVGIAGIEVSANVESGTLHILGLGINAADESLRDALNEVLDGREERNQRIVAKLQELGFNISYDDVREIAGEDIVGRPHFAQVMVARGWVDSVEEAFSRYLEKGAEAYVDRFRLQPEEAIALIRGAGGVPVMAHPMSVTQDFAELREVVAKLADVGIRGIEAYYNGHSPDTTLECLRLARHFGLLVTGGSDFHGQDVKPGIRIGVGNGSLFVPDRLLEPLLAEINPKGCFIPNNTTKKIKKEVRNE